jgi:hypothetical protein
MQQVCETAMIYTRSSDFSFEVSWGVLREVCMVLFSQFVDLLMGWGSPLTHCNLPFISLKKNLVLTHLLQNQLMDKAIDHGNGWTQPY